MLLWRLSVPTTLRVAPDNLRIPRYSSVGISLVSGEGPGAQSGLACGLLVLPLLQRATLIYGLLPL